jgi:hypothetical protein
MNSKREESTHSRPSHDLEPDNEDEKNKELTNLHENELER